MSAISPVHFAGQVKDGIYHGVKGVKGEPSSMVLNGKVEADGTAGFYGEIIVGRAWWRWVRRAARRATSMRSRISRDEAAAASVSKAAPAR